MLRQRQKRAIKALYENIKKDLEAKVGATNGISQKEIFRMYLTMASSELIGSKLQRDEEEFFFKVWPLLEELRIKDRVITMHERMIFGRIVPVWNLSAWLIKCLILIKYNIKFQIT